nr:endonuclease/exonuclease/phosphatase family protein [Zavarzinella formosa]
MRLLLLPLMLGFSGLVHAGDTPAPKVLRVLTYNIHHGEGTDDKVDLARLAEVIKVSKPDLVALQEVDRNTTRTKKTD